MKWEMGKCRWKVEDNSETYLVRKIIVVKVVRVSYASN